MTDNTESNGAIFPTDEVKRILAAIHPALPLAFLIESDYGLLIDDFLHFTRADLDSLLNGIRPVGACAPCSTQARTHASPEYSDDNKSC